MNPRLNANLGIIRLQYRSAATPTAHEHRPPHGQGDQFGTHVIVDCPAQCAPGMLVADRAYSVEFESLFECVIFPGELG
jgi:hypothetical protein